MLELKKFSANFTISSSGEIIVRAKNLDDAAGKFSDIQDNLQACFDKKQSPKGFDSYEVDFEDVEEVIYD